MLSASERILSILIIILLGIIIKINFFDTSNNNSDDSSYYKEPQPEKIKNTEMYKVINIFPRKNPTVYTQGLIYYNKTLFESGGLYKKSTLTHMKWPSQEIIKQINLEKKYFAEGITYNLANNILYQLTYKEKEILLYSFPNLEFIKKIKMPNEMREGWGFSIGLEQGILYATDGSDKIFVFNINKANDELILVKTLSVTYNMKPVYRLNELICDGIYIYANVYFEDKILKINPRNGQVMYVYNMKSLINYELKNGDLTVNRISRGDVLNGIAYIPEKKSFILTGKLWNYYYEIIFN